MNIEELELYTLTGRKVKILNSKSGLGIGGAIIEDIGEVNAGAMGFATGENIIKNYKGLADDIRAKIDRNRTYDAISFTQPIKAVAIFDAESCDKLQEFREKLHEEMKANAAKRREEKEREQEDKYPGITELRKAHNEWWQYRAEFEAMMEDEYNDGARPPKRPTSDIKELSEKYPRAALYLRAEDYANAENYHKSTAGEKAMKLLDDGGKIEEAEEILNNWLPESAMWD